ncbi:MAG TPA: pyridoxal-dependent decarboxylase, partial [Actinomycetota bacterium]|nr:pyridoxal-dependent decarboxylase [Actinomycetota bacterium]
AAARHWWAQQHGVDVDAAGLAGLPPVPVFSSGYIHMSARKALGMLGLGRDAVRTFARDDAGRLDTAALRAALQSLRGAPAIIVGNAGEVNAGDFDPIEEMADLAEEFGAWLHVDGAFGLFARVTPRAHALTRGVERAHSVASDGHKWLNVPYDCGFVFVRDPAALARPFAASSAAYLPAPDDPNPNYLFLGPDSSRRARSLAVWSTLLAYGRDGYRAMIERHLGLARHLARRVEQEPSLELLAPAALNIVCFRFAPDGTSEDEREALNKRVGAAVLEDGRVFVGTSTYQGKTVFRPAIVNWRTAEADVDALIDVLLELSKR